MSEVFLDAVLETLKAFPLLWLVYLGLEAAERRTNATLSERLARLRHLGPVVGAAAGSLPQCGFSAMASLLYARNAVTLGTLMAVYLATSDEALPILLAQPAHAHLVLPLIATKVVVALVVGFLIDLIVPRRTASHSVEPIAMPEACDGVSHAHDAPGWRGFVGHALRRALRVSAFLFLVTLGLGLLITSVGDATLSRWLLGGSVFQPLLTGLLGLVPNCAASVVIAQLWADGAIGFGSAMAGLLASAGLGLLVLAREANRATVLRIVLLLYGVSVVTGLVLQAWFN